MKGEIYVYEYSWWIDRDTNTTVMICVDNIIMDLLEQLNTFILIALWRWTVCVNDIVIDIVCLYKWQVALLYVLVST